MVGVSFLAVAAAFSQTLVPVVEAPGPAATAVAASAPLGDPPAAAKLAVAPTLTPAYAGVSLLPISPVAPTLLLPIPASANAAASAAPATDPQQGLTKPAAQGRAAGVSRRPAATRLVLPASARFAADAKPEQVWPALLGEQPRLASDSDGPGHPVSPLRRDFERRRSEPLLQSVSYSDGVSQRHRDLFRETLVRRKARWISELGKVGVQLMGPIQPALTVREAQDHSPGAAAVVKRVSFIVDWTQGPTKVGSFRVVIPMKDLQPSASKLPPPPVPDALKIRVRFKKTRVVRARLGPFESEVNQSEIDGLLESLQLRNLGKHWEGYYEVGVTGDRAASDVARQLQGSDIVLSATPRTFSAAESQQLWIAFKKSTIRSHIESGIREDDVARILRAERLTVIEVTRDGRYRVAVDEASRDAASRVSGRPEVLYAAPVASDAPEARQLVIRFSETAVIREPIPAEVAITEDQVSEVLQRYALQVIQEFGSRAYKVAAAEASTAREAVELLARESIVKSAVAVGTLPDAAVRSAAAHATLHKGMPWSATEYEMVKATTGWELERAGATAAQLAEYTRLCNEADVRGGRFNPWSGD